MTLKRNNEISIADIAQVAPDLVCLSPGPCTPNDAGICLDVVKSLAGEIPIFGVCLGHQAIGQAFGGKIVRAHNVMHGKLSNISHAGHKMFSGIPDTFAVTRYHSLLIDSVNFPTDIAVTAVTQNVLGETEIMAIAHKFLPIWGVQFHPESHLTQFGHQVLKNIIDLLR